MTSPSSTDRNYSDEELAAMIQQMHSAASFFYRMAVLIGNHAFIEFAGLMNEYIRCCKNAMKQGIDFTLCSAHAGLELPMTPFEVDYVNEKLECIYTGRIALRNKETL